MTLAELLEILARGEDSQHQFKRDFTSADSVAAELAALSNTAGGRLLIGVTDAGIVAGLNAADIARLNQLVANAATHNIKPPVNPVSTNIQTENGLVMAVEVVEGLNKPYVDSLGRIWVKSGADKRQITAREEMQRMFQQAGLVYADEVPVNLAGIEEVNLASFADYFERRYRKSVASTGLPLERLLQNLNLARNGTPNLAGLLLFGKHPEVLRPAFVVKAVAFPGTELHGSAYLDSEDIDGPLGDQYERCMAFVKRNLHHVQAGRSFNSPARLEIPEEVFEELLVNALVHRDYFISAPIRLLIFADRVEIISPGHLPDHLNTDQIRYGLSNLRNPALASHAFHILPYRGLGSGIPRAAAAWKDLELMDDRAGNQFKAIIRRPTSGVTPQVTHQVTHQVTPQVLALLSALSGEMSRRALMDALGLRDRTHFASAYLQPALGAGLVVMTNPDKPNSRNQRYRLSEQGSNMRDSLSGEGPVQ